VLAQRLEHGDEDEAVRVLDALARLDRPEARAVLEEALGGDLRTAERVVGVLGATSTVQAVTLLERALRRPELRDAAQEALAVLAGSWSSPAVADDAAAVLAGSLEAEPPGSAAEAVLRGLAGSRHAAVAARARSLLELLQRHRPEPPPRPPAPEPLPRIAPRPRGGSIRGARAESHQRDLFSLMSQGRVVPFLGPGVNALEPGGWEGQRPPTTGELASYLSERYAYPGADPRDLARVAQYVDLFLGRGPLHDTLHDLFVRDSIPSRVHDVLASMPAWLRASGSSPHLLMVTTNYDDRLERALDRMREPYDLLTYVADGEMAGGFVHVSPDGQISPVESGYRGASLSDRSVVVKLYGGVLHADPELESYLVSEDDVIDSLAGEGLMARLPPLVLASLQRGSLLFLGYGLGEWASRALLRRVRDIRRRSVRSWAVVRDPSPLDELLWEARGTSILDVDLADFMTSVEQRGTEDSA
jgi:SIR2-like protein